jgi:hypothetical protein
VQKRKRYGGPIRPAAKNAISACDAKSLYARLPTSDLVAGLKNDGAGCWKVSVQARFLWETSMPRGLGNLPADEARFPEEDANIVLKVGFL